MLEFGDAAYKLTLPRIFAEFGQSITIYPPNSADEFGQSAINMLDFSKKPGAFANKYE